MRRIWLYALPLALAALNPAIAGATGRGGPDSSVAAIAASGSTDQGYGTYTYSDVLKPRGVERDEAAEQIATRACDAGSVDNIASASFNACMSARGWQMTNFEPPAPNTYIYSDVLKPHGQERSDAVRQAATNACDGRDSDNIGLPGFNACMSARGWQFVGQTPPSDDSYASSDPSPTEDSSASIDASVAAIQSDNEQAAMNAATAAAAEQNNEAMAAATQAMNQAVFIQQ